jgi:hypothetical protein
MRPVLVVCAFLGAVPTISLADAPAPPRTGPAAALAFEMRYRGEICTPDVVQRYPEARGIPFTDTENIIPMSSQLWTPAEVVADSRRRAMLLPEKERPKGIIVFLKTERCATKVARLCSVTTAALDRRSTPLLEKFAIYGLQIKPRDGDDPPGSRAIEVGADAWKNDAAREYGFLQGPGATIVVLDPSDGSRLIRTDALEMHLYESEFIEKQGRAPVLDAMLRKMLAKLGAPVAPDPTPIPALALGG